MKNRKLITALLGMTMAAAVSSTAMAAGFVKTTDGVKYDWGNGTYCVNNWVNYRDHWFYFGDDGLMRTGWIQRDNTWYFAASTGELQAETMKINGNVYQFDKQSCQLKTGYHEYNGQTYYFTENGVTNGTPYVYTEWNSDGTLKRGWSESVR